MNKAKAERRNQILKAGARLFASKRFDEVLMDDIAQAAGVAKGTLYTYFPNKEEFYFAVIFDGISRLNEQLQNKADKPMAPEEKLRQIMGSLISFFRQNRFFFKLMSIEDHKNEKGSGTNRKRWRQERRKQMEVIESVLQSGVDQGLFNVRHIKTEAAILRDMVRSVLTSAGNSLSVDEMVEITMRILLGGISTKS